MIYPPLSKMMKTVDSRYTLVIAAAKRARQLAEGAPKLTSCNSDKTVTVAVHEIAENKISYVRKVEDQLDFEKEQEKQAQE